MFGLKKQEAARFRIVRNLEGLYRVEFAQSIPGDLDGGETWSAYYHGRSDPSNYNIATLEQARETLAEAREQAEQQRRRATWEVIE